MNEVDIHDSFDISRDRWNSAIVNFDYKRDNSIPGLDSAWGKVDLRSKVARISMITVKPEYRGKGVGKRVMVIIESLVKSLGARTIRGSAMEGSEAFWAKLGYGVIPKTRRHKFEEWRPSIIKRLPNNILRNVAETRKWKGHEVDVGLRDRWLAAVNKIPDYEVRSICTGHMERGKYGVYPAFDGVLKWLYGDPRKVIPQALRMKRELLSRLPNTIVSLNFRSGQGGVVYDGAGRRRHAQDMPGLEALWRKWEHIITDVCFGFYFKMPNKPENQVVIEQWWEAAPSIISDTFRRAKAGGSLNPKLKMVPSMMGSYWAPFKGEIVIGKADPEVVEHMPEVLGHEIGHSKLHTKGYYAVRFPAGKSLTALEKLKHELEAWDWALMKSRAVGYSRKFILDCLRSYLPGYARQRVEGEFLINQMLAKHFPSGNPIVTGERSRK